MKKHHSPYNAHQELGLAPQHSLELLQSLHILTRDGRLNQDSRRKLKQVEHLCQFIEPLITDHSVVVDHGAGKSYLGFLIYDWFLQSRPQSRIFSIESRAELSAKADELARRLQFERMSFIGCTVEASFTDPRLPATVDVVTALHACNTATDDAIRFALAKNAQHIVLVPCCQAEVAAEWRAHKAATLSATALAELWRHPLHCREMGSHVTNVLRALLLEAHGYQVNVTELIGWEHSLKNELIIARRREQGAPRGDAFARSEAILSALQLNNLRDRFIY